LERKQILDLLAENFVRIVYGHNISSVGARNIHKIFQEKKVSRLNLTRKQWQKMTYQMKV
jgi:hypothetical protein